MRSGLLGIGVGGFVLVAAAFAAIGSTTATADAAIHEIVGKHCSFDHRGNTDPPGQIRFGEQSFLRALFATGVYTDVVFGEDPDGNPGPFVTVVVDFEQPSSKFSWDGESYFSFFEPELGVTVFVPAGDPDHASLFHCQNLAP